jgi:uncharacterized protein YodC (DUF2158 family)
VSRRKEFARNVAGTRVRSRFFEEITMPQFKQGDTVRTKGGGPIMNVDAYTPSGEVVCTYWIKGKRHQENFIEATLEATSHD